MAISKIKLPDNTYQDIHDSRLEQSPARVAYTGRYSDLIEKPPVILDVKTIGGRDMEGEGEVVVSVTMTTQRPYLNIEGAFFADGAALICGENFKALLQRGKLLVLQGGPISYLVSEGADENYIGTFDNNQTLKVLFLSGGVHCSCQNYEDPQMSRQGTIIYLYSKPSTGIPASDIASGVIPDAVEANPSVPSGTTPSTLAGIKVGSEYFGIHPQVGRSQPQGGFVPNKVYVLGTLTGSVTFALASPADANIPNHYFWTFETGSTAPTITWPAGISWNGGSAPTINASKHYEISVLNGIGAFMEV